MITHKLTQKFLEFLTSAKDFDIRTVNDEESMNQLVDFFIEISLDDETDTDILEWLFSFDRVVWCTLWLSRKEYNSVISDWYGREFIKQDQFISNVISEDGKQMFIMEFIRVKSKNNRKTVEELQNELDDAVSKEDYANAAKLKKKIENKLNKTTKPNTQTNKEESDAK